MDSWKAVITYSLFWNTCEWLGFDVAVSTVVQGFWYLCYSYRHSVMIFCLLRRFVEVLTTSARIPPVHWKSMEVAEVSFFFCEQYGHDMPASPVLSFLGSYYVTSFCVYIVLKLVLTENVGTSLVSSCEAANLKAFSDEPLMVVVPHVSYCQGTFLWFISSASLGFTEITKRSF